MSRSRRGGRPLWIVLVPLVLLHFYVRPRIWPGAGAPDFLLIALIVLSLRTRPGTAAVAGFLTGLVLDVLMPVRFGAGALSHTVVGFAAAWGRTVFFPDNLIVNGILFAVGTLVRNLLLLIASGSGVIGALSAFGPASLAQAATTALAGIAVTLAIRHRVDFRLDQ